MFLSCQVMVSQVWGHSGIEVPARVRRSEQSPEMNEVRKPGCQSESRALEQAVLKSLEVRQRTELEINSRKSGREQKNLLGSS